MQEADAQLENRQHCKLLEAPMVNTPQTKVNQIIDKLHRGKHKLKQIVMENWSFIENQPLLRTIF